MQLRRVLSINSWLQLALVLVIVIFANVLGSRYFSRLDLTTDRIHSLSHASRVLAERLIVKVYFTQGLEAPYNNHEQVLVDKLEEFRAWSHGRMELSVVDPSGSEELQDEARRLGITPIPYSFRSQSRSELRQVAEGREGERRGQR